MSDFLLLAFVGDFSFFADAFAAYVRFFAHGLRCGFLTICSWLRCGCRTVCSWLRSRLLILGSRPSLCISDFLQMPSLCLSDLLLMAFVADFWLFAYGFVVDVRTCCWKLRSGPLVVNWWLRCWCLIIFGWWPLLRDSHYFLMTVVMHFWFVADGLLWNSDALLTAPLCFAVFLLAAFVVDFWFLADGLRCGFLLFCWWLRCKFMTFCSWASLRISDFLADGFHVPSDAGDSPWHSPEATQERRKAQAEKARCGRTQKRHVLKDSHDVRLMGHERYYIPYTIEHILHSMHCTLYATCYMPSTTH